MASMLIGLHTKCSFTVFAHRLTANIFYSLHDVTVLCISVKYCIRVSYVHCDVHA